ncbi:hypothetical protein BATDEDRAFT_89861 [Batrachochytrium dendrobatidis JAM81]|uniref:Uncharacterized protein n=1 Tax=Batrachochytrium dendrobatidis (strain JAM81 / FGSC 10211) TaxID=684364 RepID=F4P5E6_BATDJ|nr:uncharacterized protein BATDEDRAFT_89861 [Batrachochytrium dendrobatidis JAM81]EGF79181.1 hypothetical protein BATDEDRAFT_89861 [Batrachochytrium dendrobatidis JAM81]|eukprot:XP_006680044.1 hypothetical protein BATDEDRAFT_89861 [Batrachochytrium dendrobatidis JAM81]
MKLAVAVLSSILLACSVTIANPVKPSVTTDVESSTSPTPNPNGIGLGGLDPLPDSIKELLERYKKGKHDLNQQKKYATRYNLNMTARLCWLDLKAQEFKLRDIRKSRKECDSKCNGIEAAISHIKMSLVDLIFGESSNYELFEQQIDLINKHPSVVEYLDKLSLEYSEIPGQSSSDQQRQEPQPSSSRPSGSGSSRQKAPSNKRKRVSKLMGNAGSFFQQPKDDDPSV